jgi:hypothetical protein
VPKSAQPAKNPARAPSVTPENAYTDPAWLKLCDSRMNAYDTNTTPTVAAMNASGTACPMSVAGTVPLSAMAAVGAMIAIDNAIASQKCSSRRRPPVRPSSPAVVAIGPSSSQRVMCGWRRATLAPGRRPGTPGEAVRAKSYERSPGRYSRSAASISAGASAESAARSTRMPTRRP